MTKSKKKKRLRYSKSGPVPAEIDLEKVKLLAGFRISEREMADRLGIDYTTWKRHKEKNPHIQEMIDKGERWAISGLRMKQWRLAMDGNVAMCIFLGKQYLGQQDRVHNTGVAPGGGTTVPTKVTIELVRAPERTDS